MASDFDIIVLGGSVVGTACALGLQHAGVSVALVEPQSTRPSLPDSDWDARVYMLSPGNAAWLGDLGIGQTLPPERISRVETMQIFGDRDGKLCFSAYDAGVRELAWTVENGRLQDALWRALEHAPHVTIHSPARCADIEWGAPHARVVLDDGRELNGRLIVGADGADSWLRERAGIRAMVRPYRQVGVVANFETELAHDDTAYQWFFESGVLAFLPLAGHRVSMVWSTAEEHARRLVNAETAMLENEVTQASSSVLGAVRRIGKPAVFPLQRMRAERLVEPRAALIGDAAHVVHPLAGQGLNVGLRDAHELARVLGARAPQNDCGDYALLRRYERARKEDIVAIEAVTDGLQKLFSRSAVSLAGLRNFGLALVDAQPRVKKMLIRHAIA